MKHQWLNAGLSPQGETSMAVVPPAICASLGLPVGTPLTDLVVYRAQSHDFLDGLLSSEQARADAIAALQVRDAYELHVFRQAGPAQERYHRIEIDGSQEPVLVGLLSDEPGQNLPTAFENLVFWAALSPTPLLNSGWQNGAEGPVSNWRRGWAAHAIMALPIGLGPEAMHVLCGLFDLDHPSFWQTSRAPSLAGQATTVKITKSPSTITQIQIRLLREAAATGHPKWRCLSLYRILENAYLTNIKNTLLSEFDVDAGRALDTAKKKVSSELMQLVTLAEDADLTNEFQLFNAKIDVLKNARNHFITKLDMGAASDGLYGAPELFKKGVLRFYKLRCSIAHAGTSSVIYEQFADADQAVTQLLPEIEAIALKSLKIVV